MTTAQAAPARRVSYQLDTLWDFDYEPTHQDLQTLYETAKKNQNFFPRLTAEEQKEVEIKVSAWRLSQFPSATSRSCTRSTPWIRSSRGSSTRSWSPSCGS